MFLAELGRTNMESFLPPFSSHLPTFLLWEQGWHSSLSLNPLQKIIGFFAFCTSVQLEAGLRFFDIRIRHVHDELFIYHGPISQHNCLDNVVEELVQFLEIHPTEFVLFRLVNYVDDAEGNVISMSQELRTYLCLLRTVEKMIDCVLPMDYIHLLKWLITNILCY